MQRVIFLVDMNAFYISCEMTRNTSLVGKPAAVAGDPKKRTGIILAANYEARAYGIKTTMLLHEARKLYPGLLIVPPDHDFYVKKSTQVMELLSNYTPVLEQNSIDEAWLDMTGTEGLFGAPTIAAKRIMDEIKSEYGLWCSIGISENKFLSKMASEIKKPLGITELWKHDISKKLWPLPVRSMYGVGSKTADKLSYFSVKTIGDLAKLDKRTLIKTFGKSGIELHQHANGVDLAPVEARLPDEMKSIGRSTTLPEDTADIEYAKVILLELSEDIGISARRHNKKGNTVHITLKYSNFKVITKQMTVPATCFSKDIYHAGCKLLNEIWSTSKAVRLIGISLGSLNTSLDCEVEQLSLFEQVDFNSISSEPNQNIKNANAKDKQEKLDLAMDKIRNKYGTDKISRAIFIKKDD